MASPPPGVPSALDRFLERYSDCANPTPCGTAISFATVAPNSLRVNWRLGDGFAKGAAYLNIGALDPLIAETGRAPARMCGSRLARQRARKSPPPVAWIVLFRLFQW